MTPFMIALKTLDAALLVGEFMAKDRELLEQSVANVKQMITEGRNPTPEEWAEVKGFADEMLELIEGKINEE